MSQTSRRFLLSLFVCLLASLLTGCWLRFASGNVIFVTDIEQEVNEIITAVFADSTATVCLPTDFGFYECTYIVGGDIFTSTLYLLSELGLTGVLIDPLVVQVADDAILLEASYDKGSGPQPLAALQTVSFEAQPGIAVHAEPGNKFFILDLPQSEIAGLPSGDPTSGTPYDLSLRFERDRPMSETVTAQPIKIMLTAKVVRNGHTYYAPTLPCVTDFASIPAFDVPLSDTPQDMLPAIVAALQADPQPACDHKGYYYDAVPPPSALIYLPALSK